jgi:predicted short-subunit dehydrogenase-like oxidoreductase (DUF2520 family)
MVQVSVIGSGHVAHHFIKYFKTCEHIALVQVCARSFDSVKNSIDESAFVAQIKDLKAVDVVLICVSDSAIAEVSQQILLPNALILHTSGSQPLSVLSKHARYGVLYPLQTFSKSKPINFKEVPMCVESFQPKDLQVLKDFAAIISPQVYEISSEQRKILHIAAVFVCNFANHLYQIGNHLCEANGISFNLLKPLIIETANKINDLSPKEAQTGPAIRGDVKTMQQHVALLENNDMKNLYLLMSKMIKPNEL